MASIVEKGETGNLGREKSVSLSIEKVGVYLKNNIWTLQNFPREKKVLSRVTKKKN